MSVSIFTWYCKLVQIKLLIWTKVNSKHYCSVDYVFVRYTHLWGSSLKFQENNSVFFICLLLMSEMPLMSFKSVNTIYFPILSYLEFFIFPASACKLTLWAGMHQLCLTDIWGAGNVGRCSNLLRESRTTWKGKKNGFYSWGPVLKYLTYERLSGLNCQFTDDTHFYRGIMRKVDLWMLLKKKGLG